MLKRLRSGDRRFVRLLSRWAPLGCPWWIAMDSGEAPRIPSIKSNKSIATAFGQTLPLIWAFGRARLPNKINRIEKVRKAKGNGKFRLLARDGDFYQSTGNWHMYRVASKDGNEVRRLYLYDKFHTLMDAGSNWIHLLIYSLIYAFFFVIFALVYLLISDKCGLGLEGHFVRAYYLSLETMVTIGYGVPDPYFNSCWEGTILITVQSLLHFLLDAVIIGCIFIRLTRPQSRARTIVFSDKAVMKVINGAVHFEFQVCELKSHDLVEAHVRCYAVRHGRRENKQTRILPMRLQQPNDDMGAMIWLMFPNQIIHRVDGWSPLAPNLPDRNRYWREVSGSKSKSKLLSTIENDFVDTEFARPFWTYDWPEAQQRQVDAEQGGRDSCVCPVCGGAYSTLELLRLHTRYQAALDPQNGVLPELCHKYSPEQWGDSGDGAQGTSTAMPRPGAQPLRREVEAYLNEHHVEVVAVVEGIEPTSGSTLQARHSYVIPDDVVWDAEFADCILQATSRRPCTVDIGRFHEIVPLKPS